MSERAGKVRYICLRCGVIYESSAKVPQCPVCRSKRRMKFEEFLRFRRELSELDEFKERDAREIVGSILGGKLVSVKYEDFSVISEIAKRENKSLSEVVHEAVECLGKKRETKRKFRFW